MGYSNVREYKGGVAEWRRAGLTFDSGDDRSLRPEEPRAELDPLAP
jgi:hypothetical protein